MRYLLFAGAVFGMWSCCLISARADELAWNAPAYCFIGAHTISVKLDLKSGTDYSNVAGISGEILYDPDTFYAPRIEPGERTVHVTTRGRIMRPGVYRFVIEASPLTALPNGSALEFTAAEFLFSIYPSEPHEGQFTWQNLAAAKFRDSSGSICREKIDSFSLDPISIRCNVKDWALYE